jgi:hypothetical protein
MALRSSLAHIRAGRVSPAVLNAPPAGFVPPPQGVGLPLPPPPPAAGFNTSAKADASASAGNEANTKTKEKTRGLLEERVERDAWRGVLEALTRLRDARRAEAAAELEGRTAEHGHGDSYMRVE